VKLSAIVPAFNEERLLAGTLERIKARLGIPHQAGWSSEVIVCDNNSTDRTAELARAGGARVVFEPLNQIARARNRGARAASGDWLLFVDADSSPSPALLGEMLQGIEEGDCVGGGATLALPGAPLMVRAWAGAWNCLVILHRQPLVTSGRKAELYSPREHAAFLLGFVLSGGRSLQRRESCRIWYDGRR